MGKSGFQLLGIAMLVPLDVPDDACTGARTLVDGSLAAAIRKGVFVSSDLTKASLFVSRGPSESPMHGRIVEAVCLVH